VREKASERSCSVYERKNGFVRKKDLLDCADRFFWNGVNRTSSHFIGLKRTGVVRYVAFERLQSQSLCPKDLKKDATRPRHDVIAADEHRCQSCCRNPNGFSETRK